jgi:VWFA-related protein
MAGKTFALIAVLLSALATDSSRAAETPRFQLKEGQSAHVIAVKTSGPIWSALRERYFDEVIYLSCGKLVNFEAIVGAKPAVTPAALERLAIGQTSIIPTDLPLQTEIEKVFKKKKKFKLVPTLGGADLVLIAFAAYPTARLVIDRTRGVTAAWRGYEDSPYSYESAAVLAFVLTADAYPLTGTGVRELSDAALWQGYTQITNHGCRRSAQADAASELVGSFHEALNNKNRIESQPAKLPRSDPGGSGQRQPELQTSRETLAPPQLPRTPAEDASVRVTSVAVIVPVAVSDREGRHVSNLTQSDFRVFEDDVEQKISHFRAVETPFRVVLLLDSSVSMRLNNDDLRRAATAFVDQLQTRDQAMVVSFDSRVHVHSEFTSNRTLLHEAISKTATGLGTRLYDAVDLVLTERLNQVEGRKAIVLFTDGVDTESRLSDRQRTLELAQESGALIYSIHYDTAEDVSERPLRATVGGRDIDISTNQPNVAEVGPDAYRLANQYVHDLSEATGAQQYQAASVEELSQALSRIAAELGRQYEIAYYPTTPAQPGSYRKIVVQVVRPDTVVRARPGYRSP